MSAATILTGVGFVAFAIVVALVVHAAHVAENTLDEEAI